MQAHLVCDHTTNKANKKELVFFFLIWCNKGLGPPLTGKNRLPHALFGYISMALPPVRHKGGLKDEPRYFVLALKLGFSLFQFSLVKIRLHVCDLNVGLFQIKRRHINLCSVCRQTLNMSRTIQDTLIRQH